MGFEMLTPVQKHLVSEVSEVYSLAKAAEAIGDLPYATARDWLLNDKDFQSAYAVAREKALSFIEGDLFEMARNNPSAAATLIKMSASEIQGEKFMPEKPLPKDLMALNEVKKSND